MNIKEAFDFFELPLDVSKEDFHKKYKKLMNTNHPDRSGENEEAKKINHAKDIIERYFGKHQSDTSALVEIKEQFSYDLVSFMKTQELRQTVEFAFSKLERNHLNKYRSRKEMASIFGFLSGAAALFTRIYPYFTTNKTGDQGLLIYMLILSAISGLSYFFLSMSESSLKNSIEEFKELIEDKRNLKKLICDIFKITQPQEKLFNRHDVNEYTQKWLKEGARMPIKDILIKNPSMQSLAREIGTDEFVRLIMLKGEEKSFLTVVDKGQDVIYKIVGDKICR